MGTVIVGGYTGLLRRPWLYALKKNTKKKIIFMGRKTNSICLRLKKTNKDYIHCWYGDILYGYNFENSVKISKILSSILETVDISYPQFSLTGGHKKANLLLCYLNGSVKNKDCDIFNIPISNKIKKKQSKYLCSTTLQQPYNMFFSPKGFSKKVYQSGFFETYILSIGLNQGYNIFQGPVNKQFSSEKGFLVYPTTKHVEIPFSKKKGGGCQDYIYRGPLGLNCNKNQKNFYQTKQEVFVGYDRCTSIGQHFTFHFWPLFYNSENFFLYKFRGLTKKSQQLYKYKTKYSRGLELQQNKDVNPYTFSHSIFHYLADASTRQQAKTKGKVTTYQYIRQNLLNFKTSVVFFETCTLGKTKTTLFGKKTGPAYKTFANKDVMYNHYKQHKRVTHLHGNSGYRETLKPYYACTNFAFAKQKNLKHPMLEQQFYDNNYQQSILHNAFVVNIPLLPKQVVSTWDIEKQNYICNIYNNLKPFWGNPLSISFVKSSNEKASALFLAHYVSYFLQRKVLFRRIKRQVLLSLHPFKKIKPWVKNLDKNVQGCIFAQNKKSILGLRISCSGRVGGRSKKAQRSRKETFMWGETGLHVFSNNLDFAQTYAETSFGTVGIQVWVCYK